MPKDNQNELFYHVDDQDRVLGAVKRSEAHQSDKIIHRSVDILVFNDQSELLMQKRSSEKDTFPLFWTVSASGHVSYGQSYDEAAARELEEELGLNLPLERLYKIYVKEEREFNFIYFAFLRTKTKIEFDRDEVSAIKWVGLKQINDFARNNNLTPAALTTLSELGIINL